MRMTYGELHREAEKKLRNVLEGLEPGHFIRFEEGQPPRSGHRHPLVMGSEITLPEVRAIVVGIDIREWTRRDFTRQLVLAAMLNSCVKDALSLLRKRSILACDEPLFIIPTGDGVYVVFDEGELWDDDISGRCKQRGPSKRSARKSKKTPPIPRPFPLSLVEKALTFVLAVNAMLVERNLRDSFDEDFESVCRGGGLPVLPVYPRYVMTLDRLLLGVDVNDDLSVVGPAMLTCARILSGDHGNHLLVHDAMVRECNRHGGMVRIVSSTAAGDWDAHFHMAELPDVRIKSSQFRYVDVFGDYSEAPLHRMQGLGAVRAGRVHIGSHDVLRLHA